MHIRVAGALDAEALAEIAERTFRETFARDNTPEDMDDYSAAHFSAVLQLAELSDVRSVTLLVLCDQTLIGYAQLLANSTLPPGIPEGAMELQRFYIEASWHGKGIAQALMQRCVDDAASHGAPALWLGVWERNSRAIAFYRKSGFRDAGSQSFTLGADQQTDRVMVLSL